MDSEHLISDENERPEGKNAVLLDRRKYLDPGNGFRAFVTAIIRSILYPLRHVVRTINRSLQIKETKNGRCRNLMVALFGFTTSSEDELRETAWLDGLRGVSAFLVMVYHYHLDMFAFATEAPYGAKGTRPWEIWRLPYLRIIWCSGHTQVGIFFVLSGFVLSWSALSSIREGDHDRFVRSLGSGIFRRWIRLFLPCFAVGLLSLVQFYTAMIELPFPKQESFFAQLIDYLWECERFANPFHLERTSWEVLHKYNHTMWTMPVEWAGSLVVFVVLLMVCRINNYTKRTVILTTIPIYCCLSARWNYWLFTTGILLADYVKQAGGFENLSNLSLRSRLFWTFTLLFGGWLGGIPGKRDWYDRPGYEWTDKLIPRNWQDIEGGQRFFWCWSGIMILSSFAHFKRIRQFFEQPTCRYLGRISFMLYLTHRMVGTVLCRKILVVLSRQSVQLIQPNIVPSDMEIEVDMDEFADIAWNLVAYLVTWSCVFPLALILANWCTILVDDPSIKFARMVDDFFVSDCDLETTRGTA